MVQGQESADDFEQNFAYIKVGSLKIKVSNTILGDRRASWCTNPTSSTQLLTVGQSRAWTKGGVIPKNRECSLMGNDRARVPFSGFNYNFFRLFLRYSKFRKEVARESFTYV